MRLCASNMWQEKADKIMAKAKEEILKVAVRIQNLQFDNFR